MAPKQDIELKLNYKRTFLIGFAFFGILLLWQVYDSWCPTFLTDIFARRMYGISSAQLKAGEPEKILNVQWLVGIIMACDNLAALILLPIFGVLSDRTKTPIGKRMPYILTGTFVAAVAFPFVPLFFHRNNIGGMVAMMAIVLIFMMMYRNPAVALMPDITPKPLRAKANGIINIMGYLGGAFATVLGIFLKLSDYINAADEARKVWTIELPFLIASVLMVISALVLFFTVRENEIHEQMKEEMEAGERLAAIATPVDDDGPMSRENKTMLLAILGAEFLWFMSDNAIGTYIGNYVIYYLNSVSSATMVLTIAGGLVHRPRPHLPRPRAHVLRLPHRDRGRQRRARGVQLPGRALRRVGREGLRHGAGAQLLLPHGGGALLVQEDRAVHRLLLRGQHVGPDGHADPAGPHLQPHPRLAHPAGLRLRADGAVLPRLHGAGQKHQGAQGRERGRARGAGRRLNQCGVWRVEF